MFSKKNSAIDIQNATGQPLVRELKSSATSDNKKLIGASLIIFLGVFTGFLLSKSLGNKGTGFRRDRIGGTDKEVVGSTDTKTFRDSAEVRRLP